MTLGRVAAIARSELIVGGAAALGGTIVAGAMIGSWLDRRLNTAPIGVAVGVVVATVVGLAELAWVIRVSERSQR